MKRRGFTIIELLVVIAIIGILAALTLNSLGSARSKARDAVRKNDLAQMKTAIELYASSEGAVYPTPDAGVGYTERWTGQSSTYGAALAKIYPKYLTSFIKPPLNQATDIYAYRTNSGSNDLSLDCSGGAPASNPSGNPTSPGAQYVLEATLEAPTAAANAIWQVKSTGSSQEVDPSKKCALQ